MRKFFLFLSVSVFCFFVALEGGASGREFVNGGGVCPDSVFVGGQAMHVQGLCFDKKKECMYFSFTSRFVKTNMQGEVLASIDGIRGHLGAMTFDEKRRKVYASLECKDDEIGRDISAQLSVSHVKKGGSLFYVAVIDVDRLDAVGLRPEQNEAFKTVCIKEACRDYNAKVEVDGVESECRYGCSGIDGLCLAPKPGDEGGKDYLYVAYGVYGDVKRRDNDHQVLLRLSLEDIHKRARVTDFDSLHMSGPEKPEDKYFVYTGNTSYGVQNMAYDKDRGLLLMAVYKGKKKAFPNFNLFAVDLRRKATREALKGVPYSGRQKMLKIAEMGLKDEKSGVRGWHFKWGATGICTLGGGFWYLSENAKNPVTKAQECTARLYFFTGDAEKPFERRSCSQMAEQQGRLSEKGF